MLTITTIEEIKKWRNDFQEKHPRKKIGFVPTMGFLHRGHLSLIQKAKETADIVVVSIFVNPIQFNDKKDFEAYPIDLQNDKALLSDLKVDILFAPSKDEIYGSGNPEIIIDYPSYTNVMCGKNRPGHFQGVLYIVHNLFQYVRPHSAVFGLKDYQQYLLIKKMTEELAFDIDIIAADLMREENGLALSSRNARLSKEGIEKALQISKALFLAKEVWENNKNTTAGEIKTILFEKMKNLEIEYASVYNSEILQEFNEEETFHRAVIAVAVYIENVRLIDNVILE
ncbi:MAG: pantoate--beta-alanine ligase [Spirochaetia bacterium]|nr:pantoate--beta-alanine ligase [Spirochaetia bacterium]